MLYGMCTYGDPLLGKLRDDGERGWDAQGTMGCGTEDVERLRLTRLILMLLKKGS